VKPRRRAHLVPWSIDRTAVRRRKEDPVKRLALITVILGSALALVSVASAQVLSDGGGGGVGAAAVVPTTDPATQAVELRSEGLAGYYGAGGVTFHTDTLGGNGAATAASLSSDDTFDWNLALGMTLAGMLAIALAATMATRRRHQPRF
jgi:hypothetical protein